MADRPAGRYPVKLQIDFGFSFVLFLVLVDQVSISKWVLAAWCLLQIALGVALVRGRIRAAQRVYRCVRCERGIP